jgi:hypothetical protein
VFPNILAYAVKKYFVKLDAVFLDFLDMIDMLGLAVELVINCSQH